MTYDRTMTATVYVIDRENKKILLHLHKKFGELYPLGGHIEPHELPHEAALREVYEESGLKVVLVDTSGEPVESIDRFVLPSPAFLLHENISSPVQNLDFVYMAYLPEGTDPKIGFKPLKGESRTFYWVSRPEVDSGRIVREKELPIPGHIRRIAAMIFERID